MSTNNSGISDHYLGEKGSQYFEGGFGKEKYFGRLIQTNYFRPFCNDELILLDFGCADGFFLRNLPARKRIGVEANPVAREKCMEMSTQESCLIELHESLASVGDETVDIVISNHCLEHTLHPFDELKEMKRVLKQNGKLLLVVPFDDWRNSQYRNWVPNHKDNHLYTWSPMNLGNLLTDVGFAVEEITLIKSAWSPRLYWIYKYLGSGAFSLSCRMLSQIKNRREIFAKVAKPGVSGDYDGGVLK